MNNCTTRRTGKIQVAIGYSGISRSKLYQLAGLHPELFKKFDKSVLVDFAVLDRILDALPNARIKTYGTARREPVDTTQTRVA